MKNRLLPLGPVVLLFTLLPIWLVGCGEGADQAPGPSAVLGDDPAATLLEIFAEPDRFTRTARMIEALRDFPADQTEALREAMDGVDSAHRQFSRILVITVWAEHDPIAATKWVMNNERIDNVRSAMFAETIYRWGKQDPQSVLADGRVAAYTANGWDKWMIRGFVQGWYESGEPNLAEWIRDLGRMGDDRQRAISHLIKIKLVDSSPEEMIEWASSISGDKYFRAYVFSRLAADIAKVDPARAVAWCDEICDTPEGDDMPNWIASTWVVEGKADTMNWIVNKPNSITSRVGARSAFRKFLMHAPDEAAAWIESTPEEQRREPVLQGPVVMHVNQVSAQQNHVEALEWMKYVVDPIERDRLLKAIGRRWLRQDKDSGEAWLEETTLVSEQVKAEIRSQAYGGKKRRPAAIMN